jgi:hypothetical protein
MGPVDQLALMVRYGHLTARALVVRPGRLIYGPWARAAGLSKPERTRLWEAVREAHPTATPEGLAFVADTPPAKTAPPRRLHQRLHQLLTFPANRRPFLAIFRSIPIRP